MGACSFGKFLDFITIINFLFTACTLIVALAALHTWRRQRRASVADEIFLYVYKITDLMEEVFVNSFYTVDHKNVIFETYGVTVEDIYAQIHTGDLINENALRARQARRILKNEDLANCIHSYSMDLFGFYLSVQYFFDDTRQSAGMEIMIPKERNLMSIENYLSKNSYKSIRARLAKVEELLAVYD